MKTQREIDLDLFTRRKMACKACNLYNSLSNPAIARTDAQWAIVNKANLKVWRWIRKNLKEGIDYKEWSNGMLWPC